MGGVLALRYAQMFPDTVKKVMSCDAPGLTSLEAAKPLWKERMTLFRNEGVKALAKVTVQRWCPDPCGEDVRAGLFEQACSCTYDGYRTCAEGIMNYCYEEYLSKMEKEDVMILAGENDTAIGPREVLVGVAEKVPGARYVLMPDVGHVPPFHAPETFNKIMLDFMQS
jgi:pimeloyl-ACP methyl ester carboxylesterase